MLSFWTLQFANLGSHAALPLPMASESEPADEAADEAAALMPAVFSTTSNPAPRVVIHMVQPNAILPVFAGVNSIVLLPVCGRYSMISAFGAMMTCAQRYAWLASIVHFTGTPS